MPTDLSPLWISLKTAGLATMITFLSGTATAYWMLGYRGRWQVPIEGILMAPLILPPTVVGFLLLLLLGKNGPLGAVMQSFDFSIIFTWYAAIIAAVIVSFPLMYKTALGAFEQIDPSLLQVARTLGASEVRVVRCILLPLAVPGLLAGITLAFARALGEFGATLMLAGNIPGETQTMPMAIYFAVEAGSLTEAWLWATLIMLLSLSGLLIVNLWQQRYERSRHSTPSWIEADEPVNRGGKPLPIHSAIAPGQSHPNLEPAHLKRWQPSIAPPPGLRVEIEKQLAAFTLNTAFTAEQEPLGILGGSGSGKSMTLRCIAGVETPTNGRISLNGRVLFDAVQQINLPSHKRKVSLVFQNYALFPHMTVAQNIGFGLQQLPPRLRQQQIHQQLALVQLQGLGDRHPHQLSGGQQQRVALARALATEPEALLLDEPFSALDTYLRSQMERQLIEVLSNYRGVTLLVTHNLEEAYRVCEKLIVMSGGRTIAHDSKHRIFEHPQTVRVAQLTGCKNFSRAIAQGFNQVQAIDWGITLKVLEAIPNTCTDIGIRAHQIYLSESSIMSFSTTLSATYANVSNSDNTYPVWLAGTSETPHRMTLFLKFNAAPTNSQDYHVQAELFKDRWHLLKDHPFPWYAKLAPARLILMSN